MKKILLATLVAVVGIYFLFSHYFVDIQINKYSNLQVVKEQTAIQRGWIPAILPDSAYDIVETHDLDSNTIFGSFNYKEKDEEKFLQNLSKLNDAKGSLEWKNFLFRVDIELNKVKFRNKPSLTQ